SFTTSYLDGPEGVRTPDLMTASHARSQLRHRPVVTTINRNGNGEERSMREWWRRMAAMWLGPVLFVAVSIFLWKYVGAVFIPELLARSVFQVVPGLASVELYVTINAALLYFGGYFVVAIFWRSLKPHPRNPFTAGLVLWLVN